MDCGLTNLYELKNALLAQSIGGLTQFDRALQLIGLGVRGAFENFCNRRLAYATNDTVDITGNRPHYYVPRFPISGVTSIQMRYFQSDDWTDITSQPISVAYANGFISFGYTLGREPLRVLVTWSGGFWYETLEPDDPNYPSQKPAISDPVALRNGAVIADLPDDLRAAFLWQCEAIWAARDKLGVGISDKPNEQSKIDRIELAPLVKQVLNQYIRYQLS